MDRPETSGIAATEATQARPDIGAKAHAPACPVPGMIARSIIASKGLSAPVEKSSGDGTVVPKNSLPAQIPPSHQHGATCKVLGNPAGTKWSARRIRSSMARAPLGCALRRAASPQSHGRVAPSVAAGCGHVLAGDPGLAALALVERKALIPMQREVAQHDRFRVHVRQLFIMSRGSSLGPKRRL